MQNTTTATSAGTAMQHRHLNNTIHAFARAREKLKWQVTMQVVLVDSHRVQCQQRHSLKYSHISSSHVTFEHNFFWRYLESLHHIVIQIYRNAWKYILMVLDLIVSKHCMHSVGFLLQFYAPSHSLLPQVKMQKSSLKQGYLAGN